MDFICRRCAIRLRSQLSQSHQIPSVKRNSITSSLSTGRHVFSRPPTRPFSSSPSHPIRLAIIGSGPAGFYTASRILKSHSSTKIDMYERLPVPFGLVRYGVAPDHPEVKNCQERFEEIAESPNFQFIGNVDIGGQIPLTLLTKHYDAVLFTYGAGEDRRLGIPGEDLKGVWAARNFVGWYNGLPGYEGLDFDLQGGETAVIIGQGNVSLDVARVLLTSVDVLRKTDMPEYALEALSRSKIRRLHVVGRRGPLQAAFTIKEIRELTTIPDVSFHPIPRNSFPNDLKSLPRARRRIAELLMKTSESELQERAKDFYLRFLLSPTDFKATDSRPNKLNKILFEGQKFAENQDPFDPSAKVMPLFDPNGETRPKGPKRNKDLKTHLAFRSIGYKSTPLPGLEDIGVRFDEKRGIIPNEGGRVAASTNQPGVEISQAVPGLYVAGWVKRGPTGVIASTMEDAFATADCIAQDIEASRPFLGDGSGEGWAGVRKEMETGKQAVRGTSWRDWKRIDEVERERGERMGKEREKITDVEEMLRVLD